MATDVGPSGLASFFGGTGIVSLESPREMRENNHEGISLWLYSVERDEQQLNEPPQTRLLADGRVELIPAPLPVRLHYLITPLTTNSPDIEQRILGKIMQLFHTHASISGPFLRGELAGSDAELNVHLESLGLEQTARVWEALEGSYQLCVSYEVSLARIELDADPARFSLVESVKADTTLILEREPV